MEAFMKFFKDDPLRAFLFCAIIAIGYLYIDIRNMNAESLEECRKEKTEQKLENNKLRSRIDKLEELIDKL